MRRSVRLLSAVALVVVPLVAGVAAPAGARTAAPRIAQARGVQPAGLLLVDITGKNANAAFTPPKIKVHWSGPPPGEDCAAELAAFAIVNTTKKPVQVTLGGDPFGDPIPKHDGLYICGFGTGKAKLVLGIQGSMHILTAKFS